MQIHHDELSDVSRYIESHSQRSLEEYEQTFQTYLRYIRKFHPVDGSTRMLEIGIGTGWFPLLCKARQLSCKGLEISAQLIEHARELGRKYGIEPDLELGNIEDAVLGREVYDVIIAYSVFEHVEHWRAALRRIYDALKPGGLLLFESTNKFSFTSGEFSFPLYGWLPNAWRYRLRMAAQGPDIMKLGIDFHQFTYPGLRRAFREVGFRCIADRVDLVDTDRIGNAWKRRGARICKRSRPLANIALTFMPTTNFVCTK